MNVKNVIMCFILALFSVWMAETANTSGFYWFSNVMATLWSLLMIYFVFRQAKEADNDN